MFRGALLIADDDSRFMLSVSKVLISAGYEVEMAHHGLAAFEKLKQSHGRFSGAVFDVNMPGMSGLELVQAIRTTGSRIPTILLTGMDGDADIELGFAAGTDDYLTKPFRARELVARMNRLIQKHESNLGSTVTVGNTVFSFADFEVIGPGGSAPLSQSEVSLLRPLVDPVGRVVPTAELLYSIWGTSSDRNIRALYEHIRRVRRALEGVGAAVDIKSVRGRGYKLAAS